AKGKVTSRVPIPNDLDSETCAVKLPADDVGPMVARLHLQESSDFAIDAAHDQACLTVMDRNQNMADFGVAVAIALADGKAQTAVTFDASGNCPESPGVPAPACAKTSVGEPWVEPASPA